MFYRVNTSAFLLWKKLSNQNSWRIIIKLTLDRFLQYVTIYHNFKFIRTCQSILHRFIPILIALVALTIILPLLDNSDDPFYGFYTERVSRNCIKNFLAHFFHLSNLIDPGAMVNFFIIAIFFDDLMMNLLDPVDHKECIFLLFLRSALYTHGLLV